jgi:tetratricopeptide (TPR) repeat protein
MKIERRSILAVLFVSLLLVLSGWLLYRHAIPKLSVSTSSPSVTILARSNVSDEFLTEARLQPVWFGPPRLIISESLDILFSELNKKPKNSEVVSKVAMKLSQERQWKESLKYYRRWIELDPSSVNAWIGAAYALVNLNRAEEAISLLDSAKKRSKMGSEQLHYIYSTIGDVYLYLALSYKSNDNDRYYLLLDYAKKAYRQAKALGDVSSRPDIGLVRIAIEKNDFDSAKSMLDRLYSIGVESVRQQALVAYYQGVVHERQGKVQIARRYYRAAIQADPSSFALLK